MTRGRSYSRDVTQLFVFGIGLSKVSKLNFSVNFIDYVVTFQSPLKENIKNISLKLHFFYFAMINSISVLVGGAFDV